MEKSKFRESRFASSSFICSCGRVNASPMIASGDLSPFPLEIRERRCFGLAFFSTPWADKNTSASKLRDRLHKSILQLRPPNFDSDDATCNFSFGHPTSTSPTRLQLRQCNFNLGRTTSTSLMQLQLCTVNLNFKFELQF